MGLIVKALEGFAKSGVGTKLYKWSSTEKGHKWLCESLPLIETAMVTSCRVIATEKQKLPRREKNMLQWQNLAPASMGILAGSYLNKKAFALSKHIGDNLDPEKVKDLARIQSALKVATPIFTTAFILRFLSPIITGVISSKVEDNKRKKLDIKA